MRLRQQRLYEPTASPLQAAGSAAQVDPETGWPRGCVFKIAFVPIRIPEPCPLLGPQQRKYMQQQIAGVWRLDPKVKRICDLQLMLAARRHFLREIFAYLLTRLIMTRITIGALALLQRGADQVSRYTRTKSVNWSNTHGYSPRPAAQCLLVYITRS